MSGFKRHRCTELPCPECGMDLKAWADANRVEAIERQNRTMHDALLRIASLSEGMCVSGAFDEPNAAQVAREALASGWIGPCAHGRDPFDRCDFCSSLTEVEAWALAHITEAES